MPMPLPMSSLVMVRVRPCVVSFLHRALSFGNERCGSAAPTRLLLALALLLLLLLVLGPHASQCRLLANFIHSCCASRLCRSSNAAQLRLGQNFSVLSSQLSSQSQFSLRSVSVSAQSQSQFSLRLSSVCVSVQSQSQSQFSLCLSAVPSSVLRSVLSSVHSVSSVSASVESQVLSSQSQSQSQFQSQFDSQPHLLSLTVPSKKQRQSSAYSEQTIKETKTKNSNSKIKTKTKTNAE